MHSTLECHMLRYNGKLTTNQRENKEAYSLRAYGLQQGDTQKEVSNVRKKK